MPMRALIEPLSTMDAPGLSSGSSACNWKKAPLTLVEKVWSQSASVASASGAKRATPA